MYVELALAAGQAVMMTAATAWQPGGGDMVALVQEALDVYARGFANPRRGTRT